MRARLKFVELENGRATSFYVSIPKCDLEPVQQKKLACAGCHRPIKDSLWKDYYVVSQLQLNHNEIKYDVVCKECKIPLDGVISDFRAARASKQAQSAPEQEAASFRRSHRAPDPGNDSTLSLLPGPRPR